MNKGKYQTEISTRIITTVNEGFETHREIFFSENAKTYKQEHDKLTHLKETTCFDSTYHRGFLISKPIKHFLRAKNQHKPS